MHRFLIFFSFQRRSPQNSISPLFYKPLRVFALARLTGLEPATFGFHSLRSTFITRLGEAGVPLAVVREMVGHVSEDMSQRYFRADDSMAAKAIAALG